MAGRCLHLPHVGKHFIKCCCGKGRGSIVFFWKFSCGCWEPTARKKPWRVSSIHRVDRTSEPEAEWQELALRRGLSSGQEV
jgi:hypothetical protein